MKRQHQLNILIWFALIAGIFFMQVTFTKAGTGIIITNPQLVEGKAGAAGTAVSNPTPVPTFTNTPPANRLTTKTRLQTAANAPLCDASLDSWQRHVIAPGVRTRGESTNFAFAVDVNGDHWEDVINGAYWYENPQSSIASSWVRHDVGTGFSDVIDIYDFDGDGDIDLLGVSGANWPLVWAENNGAGSFAVHTNIESDITIPLPDPVTGVIINHFTLNGPLEVAITWDDTEKPDENPHGIQIFKVPADPKNGVWERRKLADFSNGEELTEADIDNDGDLDIYIGNFWLRNEHPNPVWSIFEIFVPSAGEVDRTFVYDVDLDGDLDTIDSYGADPEGKIAWYEQPDGSPFATWTQHMIYQSDTYPGFVSLAIGDMDADGDFDVVAGEHQIFGDTSIARTYVFENLDGLGGSWQEHLIYTGDESNIGMDLADFDHDGDMDVLSTGTRHTRVHIYENLSNHTCGTPVATATPIHTFTPTNTPDPNATPTSTPTPTATHTASATLNTSCVPDPANVLANPSFEDGKANWTFFTNGSGSYAIVSPGYHCSNAARLTFTTINDNMQLYQHSFPLKANTAYRLSFDAYSNTGHDLQVYVQKHTDPYTHYGVSGIVFNLTNTWQEFNHEFTTTGFSGTSSDTRLRFWFVGKAGDGDQYWLDNIRLQELSAAGPTNTPTPTPTASNTPTPTATSEGGLCSPILNSWQRHVIEPDRPSGQSVYSFALDINNDQWDDVLSGAHWYENPKTGISSSWTRHDIGAGFQDLVDYYDFDGDGDLDLLGVAGGNWPLVWAENDGSGNFTVHTNIESGITVPLPDPVQGVAIGHFTADGPLEIAITWDDTENPASNPHGIQMITVPADPETSTWTRRKLSDFSRGEELSPYDIDNDGDVDLYIGNYWLRNEHPSTTWTVFQTFIPSDGHADRSYIFDMDKDGDMDTVDSYSHDPEGKVAWYENPDGNPFGTWTEHLMFQGNHFPGVNSLNIGDMDNDGDIDIVAGEHSWTGDQSVLRTAVLENLDGFGGSWQTHLIYQGDEAHVGMGIADFDHDGDRDVSSTGYTHNRIHIYENKSDHGCGTPIPTATPIPTWTPIPTNSSTTITLVAGWNLISSNILPGDPLLETVLAGITNNMVLMKNGAGQHYWPAMAINDIGSWNVVDGYQMYMNNPDTLLITGPQVDPLQTPIELLPGMNIVSYLPQTALPGDQALASINGSFVLVKNGDGELYWPEFGINQIGNMQPGEGYAIYMTGPGTLTYPAN